MPTPTALGLIALCLAGIGQARPPMDERIVPPEVRKLKSPSGKFRAELYAPDHWKTLKTRLRFFKDGKVAWDKALPHAIGPRYAVLSDSGTVCLIDEFANIKSDRAIMAYDIRGNIRLTYSVDHIGKALGVTDDQMIDHAAKGWWVSSPPVLKGEVVTVATAGHFLAVDLGTKKLSKR